MNANATCDFVLGDTQPCYNKVYKGTVCKFHTAEASKHAKHRKSGIYVKGLHKNEQDLYEDISTGTLAHEIKIAKLQLRRLLIGQLEAGASPSDIDKMIASDMNIENVIIKNGKMITTSGLPVDMLSELAEKVPLITDGVQVIPAALVKTDLHLTRIDYMSDIARILRVIMQLEKVHYEIMGGTSEDPDFIAKQIYDALTKIERNARGELDELN